MQNYAIKEASELSGLPESTLRYYETMGLIGPIARDPSSKHRVYSENDVNFAIAISCLSATGMSIEDMRKYLKNVQSGEGAAEAQITLLEGQKNYLEQEMKYFLMKQKYVETKIWYWKAVISGDTKEIERITKEARWIAKDMKPPKKK